MLLICCQQNKFWHVEIKAYSPFWGPLLYNWNVGSACSFLSLDTLLCFFLCFLCYFLPFFAPLLSLSHSKSVWIHLNSPLPSFQLVLMFLIYTWTCFCMGLPFYGEIYPIHQLLFCAHYQRHRLSRILPRTHCSSKYCISVPEKCDLLLSYSSDHICVFLPLKEFKWKEVKWHLQWDYSLFFIQLVCRLMLCHAMIKMTVLVAWGD